MAGQSFNKRKNSGRYGQFSEINVTPFVDVMLVLLIVFMVSAPLLSAGVSIDLPESEAKAITDQDNTPLEVSLDKNGDIFIGETKVERKKFVAVLNASMKSSEDKRIYIRADEGLPYARVMDILGVINNAGYSKVALISTQPD